MLLEQWGKGFREWLMQRQPSHFRDFRGDGGVLVFRDPGNVGMGVHSGKRFVGRDCVKRAQGGQGLFGNGDLYFFLKLSYQSLRRGFLPVEFASWKHPGRGVLLANDQQFLVGIQKACCSDVESLHGEDFICLAAGCYASLP